MATKDDTAAKPGSVTVAFAPQRVKKSLANLIGDVSTTLITGLSSPEKQAQSFDRSTAAYAKTFLPELRSLAKGFNRAIGGIQNVETEVNKFYGKVLESIENKVGGFSEHMRAIVVGLDNMLEDPLNSKNVSNMAAAVLNRSSPGASSKLNQTFQNMNLDKLAKAPGLLFSSAQRLARGVDNVLSIPIAFASLVYFGCLALVKEIGRTLSRLIQGFEEFIFDALDELLPITELLDLLETISTLASQIQGIASTFYQTNIVSQYTLQINTAITQFTSVVENPLDFAIGALPNNITLGISEIIYNLNNPQNFINELLPPELSQMFAKVTAMTGFGFNGNMGYNFTAIMKGFQEGVLSSTLKQFASQYSILGPLLSQASPPLPLSYNAATNNGFTQTGGSRYQDNYKPNPNMHGLKDDTTDTPALGRPIPDQEGNE